ncbi:hypothetical protein ACHHYP_17271 [Achlya hypogyna]|uniref:Uncharacterized protein n=1 Tax=Achlya hypogyna TaxID=1202772 RepID=A0A1V9Y4U5_ACHHY|nr:hypothetical protein ACHHYP_17271 [Achlya hypogyna]
MVATPLFFAKAATATSTSLPLLAALTGAAATYTALRILPRPELDIMKLVHMELEDGAALRRACFEFDKHNPQLQAQTFDCLYENVDNQHVFYFW